MYLYIYETASDRVRNIITACTCAFESRIQSKNGPQAGIGYSGRFWKPLSSTIGSKIATKPKSMFHPMLISKIADKALLSGLGALKLVLGNHTGHPHPHLQTFVNSKLSEHTIKHYMQISLTFWIRLGVLRVVPISPPPTSGVPQVKETQKNTARRRIARRQESGGQAKGA